MKQQIAAEQFVAGRRGLIAKFVAHGRMVERETFEPSAPVGNEFHTIKRMKKSPIEKTCLIEFAPGRTAVEMPRHLGR